MQDWLTRASSPGTAELDGEEEDEQQQHEKDHSSDAYHDGRLCGGGRRHEKRARNKGLRTSADEKQPANNSLTHTLSSK